jgi:hypothetical protein
MKRLILTTDDTGAGNLKQTGLADIVIPFGVRFVWGPLLSDQELDALLGLRSPPHDHWFRSIYRRHFGEVGEGEIGIIDLCHRCDTIELWIDPDPNAQLTLVWLLNWLRAHEKIVAKLRLVQADVSIGKHPPEELIAWQQSALKIGNDDLETATAVWRAYRAPTPHAWFNLLTRDWRVLPQLGHAVLELLEELPARSTGLGATEMRMLELASAAQARPFDLFPGHEKHNKRRAYGYWEVGALLDGLARCPAPAVSGLTEGPFTLEMHEDASRHRRYTQSSLSLTALGAAILARADDFSRHNPIHRWWGGTELTNDRLWRWDLVNRALIAP